MRLRTIAVVAVLAVGTACRSDDGGTARLARTVARVSWTNSDFHWVTQPRLVGGRFVAYLEQDGQLGVAALDVTNGKVAWRFPASLSSLTAGVAAHLTYDDPVVYFGTPVDVRLPSDAVFVVAVDATTGAEVWRTAQPLILADSLRPCDDDSTVLCASDGGSLARRIVRIAKATGQATTAPTADGPAAAARRFGGRALGAGLYDTGSRDPDVIAAVDSDGRTLWTKTAPELFQGRPVSSDYGWSWNRYGDLLVGWLGTINLDRGRHDLAEHSIAGVEAATGSVVWVDDGAHLGCGGLLTTISEKPIRCRMTGTVTSDPDVIDDDLVVTGLTVVMEEFDPATGAAVWQADLGPALALVSDQAPLVRLSPREFAIGREDGSSIAVDIVSGHTRTPEFDEVGWCLSENEVRDSHTLGDPLRRVGHDYLSQCRTDGSSISVLASSPIDGGAWQGQTFAWMDARGMHAATTGWVRW